MPTTLSWIEKQFNEDSHSTSAIDTVARNLLLARWLEEDSVGMAAPIAEYRLRITTKRMEEFKLNGMGKQNMLCVERVLGQQDRNWLILKIYVDDDSIPKIYKAPRDKKAFWPNSQTMHEMRDSIFELNKHF